MTSEQEFCEVFFDDVVVPADRILGEVDGGWAVAMSILPYERSSCFWQRIAYLYARLQRLVDVAPDDERTAEVGEAYLQLHALRARSRATQHPLAETGTLGAETSVDKVLVATADQTVYDAVRRILPGTIEFDDSAKGETWRREYLYSRAATIYGGTLEVQRNIIARRLLALGSDEWLADALVAVEALEAALGAARDEPNADTAALAKAVAGRTARTVATHCQQARGALRIGRRDRPRRRPAAARHAQRSDPDRAVKVREPTPALESGRSRTAGSWPAGSSPTS